MRGAHSASVMVAASAILAVVLLPALVAARCPYASSGGAAGDAVAHPADLLLGSSASSAASLDSFDAAAFQHVNFEEVKEDIAALLVDSQPEWPADFGTYAPFFIRLAWHCAGTYRTSDGRGGCDGARQRFSPEMSWPDNTNLDKARALLAPIKAKHGKGLSWGDLIMLSGTEAIRSMGGPVLGFCAGRIDEVDGAASLKLGPSAEQQAVAPCEVNGECEYPLGATTVGLIYVNPEGPMGKAIPEGSAPQIRATFGGMGLTDAETVALIGGGHAFGKVHGACTTGAGPSPEEDPEHPWPGTCGEGEGMGKGNNTFTSGFEGSWTTRPTQWSNDYFVALRDNEWEVHEGPGGHQQWKTKAATAEGQPPIMMLTSDVALLADPIYKELVLEYAENPAKLDDMFAHAWYKMATRDMGPITRCLGDDIPPAQPFQYPLPSPPKKHAEYYNVKAAITKVLHVESAALPADIVAGKPYYGAIFATLAYRCASTFRATDYLGGCNGARLRLSPEKDWPENVAMDAALAVLDGVKAKYGDGISYADLIVLAGQTAVEDASGLWLGFCGGRVDATDGAGSTYLARREYGNAAVGVRDRQEISGLPAKSFVALQGGLRSPGQQVRLGYSGSWSASASTKLDNAYFVALLGEDWRPHTSKAGKAEFKAHKKPLYMTPDDVALLDDPEFRGLVEEYAEGNEWVFKGAYGGAWGKLMNADRFKGPAGSMCGDDDKKPALSLWQAAVELAEQVVEKVEQMVSAW